MEKIRTLVVDDEPLARERITDLLAHDAEAEIIGECGDGLAAVAAIEHHKPDLLFLDVQMPELDGFGVLEAIESAPVTIFVTAYDQYALRAFEVHALDYLLKPFDRERFDKALQRAKRQIARERAGAVNQELVALLADLKTRPKPLERLVIKAGGRVFFLRVDEIDWIEAAANYVKLHAGKESHLLRETINGLAAKLDPDKFLRIHRSIIVNLERVKELQPWFHGDYVVIMQDGAQLTSSRNYREHLRKLLGKSN
ncbi:MAG TPA: LytTR family DNA-binding domain-containing protein [Blastocatellia bacterium]|nr:LytTR family DNA-binding domain-containing protein [Blastocatellia bacterium]